MSTLLRLTDFGPVSRICFLCEVHNKQLKIQYNTSIDNSFY